MSGTKIRIFLLYMTLGGVMLFLQTQPVTGSSIELPESAFVEGFVGHPQTYTLSCESRSAVDWAAFWGVWIDEIEFLNSLTRSDNPEVGFVGDPNGYWGNVPPNDYGVHARPVAALLRGYGLNAVAKYGFPWDGVRSEIAAGRPVIVWVIGQMWGGTAVEYTASNGDTVKAAAFEHTMVVVGYDAAWVHVVDASTGWVYHYDIETFRQSWEVLGRMAVIWEDPAPPEPTQTPTSPPTETPVPTAPSTPTATPKAVSYINQKGTHRLYLPVVGKSVQAAPAVLDELQDENVMPAGVCLYRSKGVLQAKPFHTMRGWCISADLIRPEYVMGIVGPIPDFP